MFSKLISGVALLGCLLAGAAGVAVAGESSSLAGWKAQCSEIISQTMRYPWRSFRSRPLEDAYNVVEAVIDRSGRVIEARLSETSGVKAIDRQSERFARSIKALPALPAGFEEDRAVVRMYLMYANSDRSVVTLTEKVLAAIATDREKFATEDATRIAGLPVIDMIGGI